MTSILEILKKTMQSFTGISMQRFFLFCKEKDITPPQMRILLHIHNIGFHSVSNLGCDFGVSSAAASQMIDKLDGSDLIKREEDPNDRRSKVIELSNKGKGLIKNFFDDREKWLENLLHHFSQEEKELLEKSLKILLDKIKISYVHKDSK